MLIKKLAKGAAWMIAFRLTQRSLGLISTLFLARLLMPQDFGLVAMAMSVIELVELVSAFGFDNALIQQRDPQRHHYDAAFTLNVCLGLGCAAVILLLAYPTATFYGEPRLAAVMAALAGASAVQGFENIGTMEFRRGLHFHREFHFQVIKRLLGFIVTLVAAFTLRSYWALVIGIVTGRLAGVFLSYLMHPYRPRFSLRGGSELMSFSVWLLANNAIGFANTRFPHFVIGRVIGSSALGMYTLSNEISSLPTSELLAPINRAIFPGFVKIAHDHAQLRDAILDVMAAMTLVAAPAAFGIAAVAEPLVYVVLSAKWADAVPLIRILGFLGVVAGLMNSTYPAYLALGRPRLTTWLNAASFLIFAIPVMLAISRFGLIGVAWVQLIVSVVFLPVSLVVIFRVLDIKVAEFTSRIWRPLLAATIMFFVVRAFIAATAVHGLNPHGLPMLLASVVLGAAVFAALLGLLWTLTGRPRSVEARVINMLFAKFNPNTRST